MSDKKKKIRVKPVNTGYFETPYGELILGSHSKRLCLCDWRERDNRAQIDARLQRGVLGKFIERDDDLLRETRRQLDQYFARERKQFELPLLMIGSPFQRMVWNRLCEIPYGQTASYLDVAEALGNAQAVRAVASANGANAISIIVPCHRVVGSSGKLVGYAGGLETKAKLLRLEFDLVG